MPTTCPIKKHPDTGLLYILEGSKATIVGCTQADLTHLEIPPVIIEDGVQYLVTAVGESAFAYQACLQTLRIPARLSRIDHGAFEGSGLTAVVITPVRCFSLATTSFDDAYDLRALVTCAPVKWSLKSSTMRALSARVLVLAAFDCGFSPRGWCVTP